MVYQFLKGDCDTRIPLIKVFEHPWCKRLEEQALAERGDDDSSESDEDADDESSSCEDEYDDESDSDSAPDSVDEDSEVEQRNTSYLEGDSEYYVDRKTKKKQLAIERQI